MALNLTYRSGTNVSIGTTETSLMVDGGSTSLQTITTPGVYTLFLESKSSNLSSPMVKADEFEVTLYEKAVSGGDKLVAFRLRMHDAQSEAIVIPNLMLGVGFDITVKGISANARNFNWSVRQAA